MGLGHDGVINWGTPYVLLGLPSSAYAIRVISGYPGPESGLCADSSRPTTSQVVNRPRLRGEAILLPLNASSAGAANRKIMIIIIANHGTRESYRNNHSKTIVNNTKIIRK